MRIKKVREDNERGLKSYSTYYEVLHEYDYRSQDQMSNPIAFLAKKYDDTMYYHQAMQEPDADEFKKTVVKKIHDHCAEKYWKVVQKTKFLVIVKFCHQYGQ